MAQPKPIKPKLKICRDGEHLYKEYVGTKTIDGIEYITARCADCREEYQFPALAKHRKESTA